VMYFKTRENEFKDNSIDQILQEADSHWASEIPHLVWNPKICYHINKRPPPIQFLNIHII
jgi:hypothetical protein